MKSYTTTITSPDNPELKGIITKDRIGMSPFCGGTSTSKVDLGIIENKQNHNINKAEYHDLTPKRTLLYHYKG